MSWQDMAERMLETLTPKEREILKKRFGIPDDQELTVANVAKSPQQQMALERLFAKSRSSGAT